MIIEDWKAHLVNFAPWIKSRVFKLTRRRDSVEDDYQEVVARAMKIDPETLAGLESPEAYLQRIIESVYADQYRKQSERLTDYEGGLEEIDNLKLPLSFRVPSASEESEAHELLTVLESLFDSLPPRSQMVYRLRVSNELPFSAIAQQMGITVSTAKKLQYAAEQKMKKGLIQATQPRREGSEDVES